MSVFASAVSMGVTNSGTIALVLDAEFMQSKTIAPGSATVTVGARGEYTLKAGTGGTGGVNINLDAGKCDIGIETGTTILGFGATISVSIR